jgi:hypothetical protein
VIRGQKGTVTHARLPRRARVTDRFVSFYFSNVPQQELGYYAQAYLEAARTLLRSLRRRGSAVWPVITMTLRSWRTICATYRALVAAQTLGWAVAAFASISRRSTVSPAAHLPAMWLTGAAALCLLGGMANYAWRRLQPSATLVAAILRSWLALQLGGAFALGAFVVSSRMYCFVVGAAALSLMHLLSPNRFQHLQPSS